VPVNGAFRASDLPDQVSGTGDVAAQWQAGRVRLGLRVNQVGQDNRQETRENADFASGVRALSVGTNLGSRGDVSVDAADEFQTAKERNETTRVRRLTLNAAFRPHTTTNLIGAVSVLRNRQPSGLATVNTEQHLELSQAFAPWPRPDGSQRGQLFVRYARTGSLLPEVSIAGATSPTFVHQAQWTVSSGLNVRLF